MISEKYLRELFKLSVSPMMILLPDAPIFSVLEVNDAWLQLKKVSEQEVMSKDRADLALYVTLSEWDDSLQKVLLQKKVDKIGPVAVKAGRQKETTWWEITNTPMLNEDDEVEFIFCSVNDVTQQTIAQKNTEQALADSRSQFNSLLQTIEGAVWEAEADSLQFTFVSDNVKQILGFLPEEWLTQPHFRENHIHEADKEEVLKYRMLKFKKHTSYSFEYRMIKADGGIIWIKDIVSVISEKGRPLKLRGLIQDITAVKRSGALEHLERDVLELNSRNEVTIQQVLTHYLTEVERMFPKMQCSILQVKNNRLHSWAAPSLPIAYVAAIENLSIGPNVGSCGTAAFLKEKVIVSDIENDPRWVLYKHIALSFNLRACWSHPIVNSDGEVMATLGMYYQQIRKPEAEELKVIDRVTALLQIILENRQKSEILEETRLLMIQGQELAHFGNWSWDVQNNVVSWSDALYSIYGVNKKDFKATFEGYQELLHPADRQRVYKIIETVLKNGKDIEFEERIVRPSGEIRHLKSWGKLKTDENGLPVRMIGACLDITESKAVHEELQTSQNRMRALADAQTNYVTRLDLDGKYIYCNKKYLEDFDWILRDKILTDTDATIGVQPYHHQLVADIKQKCIENPDKVYQVEIDKLQEDGSVKPTLWHIVGLSGPNGKTDEIQCIGLDITDLKNAENELKISNERYEYVNKATNDAIFDWDLINDKVTLGNSFFRLFGFDTNMQNLSFGKWGTQVHPADIKKVETDLGAIFNDPTKGRWSAEYRFKKANGHYAYIEGNGYIIRNEAGQAVKMIGVMKDISEMQEHIGAIEKQNQKLLEIAWMQSHGVRAPLAKIMGLVDLIKNFPNSDIEKSQLLGHLLSSAYELDNIIKTISEKTEHIDSKMARKLKR